MFGSILRFLAVAVIATAVTASTSLASSSARLSGQQVSRLGSQTEAAGYAAITRYLVQHPNENASRADVAQLGAQTEAKGYRALVGYQQRVAATPEQIDSSPGFAWGDAFAGAGFTAGVFLVGATAALALRRRQLVPRPRH